MKREHERRGLNHRKALTALAITALFLSGGSLASVQAAPMDSQGVAMQQQQQQITITVVDRNGEPIIGANVLEKGTQNGMITDLDGRATLRVAPGVTLQVSFIGYQPQEVKAANNLRVVLKEDNELLDEVVVVGYGTQKKVNLTGAVASVDVDKTIDSRPITDIGRALQGAVPVS